MELKDRNRPISDIDPATALILGSALLSVVMGGMTLHQAEAQENQTSLVGTVRVMWGDRINKGQVLQVIGIDTRDENGNIVTKQIDTYQNPDLKSQLVALEGKTIQLSLTDEDKAVKLMNVQRSSGRRNILLQYKQKVGMMDCGTADASVKSPQVDYSPDFEQYLDTQLQNPDRADRGRVLGKVTTQRTRGEYLKNGGYPDLPMMVQDCVDQIRNQNISDINIFFVRVPEGTTYTAWGGRMMLKVDGLYREVGFAVLPDLGWPEQDLAFHELLHAIGGRHTSGPLGEYNSQNSALGDPNAGCDKNRIRQRVCGQNANGADLIDFGVATIVADVYVNEAETVTLNGRELALAHLPDGRVIVFEYRERTGYDQALNDGGVVATIMDRVRNKNNYVVAPSGDGLAPDIFFQPGETINVDGVKAFVFANRRVSIGNQRNSNIHKLHLPVVAR